MGATDSIPVPKKNTAFRLYFTVRDASGVPVTGFTSPDSEVSKDGAAFADCTNEATYVGHGNGYIDLTSTEMNADSVCYYMSCTEGNIDIAIAPEEAGDIRADLTQLGGSTQSAADLKDFADTGYDPATHKVQGVVLADSATTLTNAPSDSAGVTTLLTRLSALRAGYLDNLSAGAVALEASLQAIITTIGASAAGVAAAVWSYVSRVLTAGTNIALAKGTGVTGFTDLDAVGVRTALGMASANMDSKLGTPAGASISVDIAAAKTVLDTVASRTDVATSTRLASSGNAGTGGVLLGDEEDVYPADIQLTVDEANTCDEYTVQWFRNGSPVVSGVTVPLIQVVKRADGTDLIASTAMTQIGSTGAYKYDATTDAERNTAGEAVLVHVSATINGSSRTWRKLITRDSAAA